MLSVAMKDLVLFAVMLTNTAMSDEAVTRFDADPVVCCVARHCMVKLIQRPPYQVDCFKTFLIIVNRIGACRASDDSLIS